MERHNCGGTLEPAKITVEMDVGSLRFIVIVDGLRCTQCSEEVISRDVALALEQVMFENEDEIAGRLFTVETPQIVSLPVETTTEEGARLGMNHALVPAV